MSSAIRPVEHMLAASAASIAFRECTNLRLHFKILTPPTSFSTDEALRRTRQIFNSVGIGVELVSTETLNLPMLTDLEVGHQHYESMTAEHNRCSVTATPRVAKTWWSI